MGSFWIVLSTFFISCAYVSIKAMPVSMAFYEIFLLRSIVVLSVAICLVAATKTSLKTHEPPIRTLFWFALACTVSGAAATLMFSKGLQAEHVFSIPVLLMGVFTALGQWTQNIGWKKGKTLLCASLQFSAVIFAVIFGYLFFDEIPDAFTFLGILIIVASSLGATIFRLKYYKEG